MRGLYDGLTGTLLRQMTYSLARFAAYDWAKGAVHTGESRSVMHPAEGDQAGRHHCDPKWGRSQRDARIKMSEGAEEEVWSSYRLMGV